MTALDPRTSDITYEPLGQYPAAREAPIRPAADYLAHYRKLFDYQCTRPAYKPLLRAALALWHRASGFVGFVRRLAASPEGIDDYLRRNDLLKYPDSLLELSYSMLLADDPEHTDAIDRAATLLAAAIDFHRRLRSGELEPDQRRGEPLEMGQYPHLFSTHLVPTPRGDVVYKSREDHFVVVMIAGRFYRMEVATADPPETGELKAGLLAVAELDRGAAPETGPGLAPMSAVNRRRCGEIFEGLRGIEANHPPLEILENALLIVCLDLDRAPDTAAEACALVHSGNAANRWYHAGTQLVVFGNGKAGVLLSARHYIEGNVGARFAAEIQRRAARLSVGDRQTVAGQAPKISRLHFTTEGLVDPEELEREIGGIVRDDPDTFEIAGAGEDLFRSHGVNPDAAFKLALLAASRELLAADVKMQQIATMSRYRSMCMVRAFVSTPQAVAFCDALDREPPAECARLFRQALSAHAQALRDVRKGVWLPHVVGLFLRRGSRWQRWLTTRFVSLVRATCSRIDVVTSHPARHPEVVLFGRPGVRLPYVRYYGLHYQIRSDKIEMIFMPARRWRADLAELAGVVERKIDQIRRLLPDVPIPNGS